MISNVKLRVPVTESDHSQGPDDAPLVLVEYGDYECSFCGKAERVIKRIQQEFGKDLRTVFRNFPLTSLHPNAFDAARAAEAAGLQKQFWEMHDLLYRRQDQLDPESLLEYAQGLGLDMNRFSNDFESPEVEERIAQDQYGGIRGGVNGTPTFFVNGYRYDGDWSYEPLFETLSEERAAAFRDRAKKPA